METLIMIIDTDRNASAALLKRGRARIIVFDHPESGIRIFKLYDDGTWEEV